MDINKKFKKPFLSEINWYEVSGQVLTIQQEKWKKGSNEGEQLTQNHIGLIQGQDKQYPCDQFLKQVIGGESKEHIALVGPGGTGKTSLLNKIATFLWSNHQVIPIYISLSHLEGGKLKKYLRENWLEQALPIIDVNAVEVSKEMQISLIKRFRDGGVVLFLDGLEQISTTALTKIGQQFTEEDDWLNWARIILACRLDFWQEKVPSSLKEALNTYEILEFSQAEITEFIKNWLKSAAESERNELTSLVEQLISNLNEGENQAIRQWLKNPLLLQVLCETLRTKHLKLPLTKAGILKCYQYVKKKQHELTPEQEQALNQALGKLALTQVNRDQFIGLVMATEKSSLNLACDLGWLKKFHLEYEVEPWGYTFVHPAFETYWAAKAISDWKFFLTDVTQHPRQGIYRIFDQQWQDVIQFWLGREDIAKEQKKAFIQALTQFKDNCEQVDFYSYRACFVAASMLAECSEIDQLAEIIINQLKQWLIDLSQHSEVRQGAAWGLGEIGSEQAVEYLIVALKDEDENLRRVAVEALGKITSDQAVKSLIDTLKEEALWIRKAAVEALGKIASKKAVEPLIAALKEEDIDLQVSAVQALGKIGAEEAGLQLLGLLKHKNENLRAAAAFALGEIGSELAMQNLLMMSVRDEEEKVRSAAAMALRKINPDRAIDALVRNLRDKDSWVRKAAVEALGNIGSEKAIPPLVQNIRHKDTWMREAVAKALGEIGLEQAVQPLVAAMQDEALEVRKAAAAALGNIGSEEAVQPLVAELGDGDLWARKAAVAALGKIGSQKAVESLIGELRYGESWVQKTVLEALGEINSEEVVELLIPFLSDEDLTIKKLAAEALGKIGSEEAVKPLIAAVKTEKSWVKPVLAEALGKISQAKPGVREEVVRSLRELWLPEADKATDKEADKEADKKVIFSVLWQCAQNMPYQNFYQAWQVNSNSVTPISSLSSKESAAKFLEDVARSNEFRNHFTSVTNRQEFIQVCEQLGYTFATNDLKTVVYEKSQRVKSRRMTGVWPWIRNIWQWL